MEQAVSEIIKIFTTMLFILLLVGMIIMGKHLSDVNSFKEYVNTQIERNGGYTEEVKTNVEKMNEDSYNNLFFVYEPSSNTKKKIEPAYFGDVVKYEIHANIPIPFTPSGKIEFPIAFKGQAIARTRNAVKHTAYAWSADGTDRFTTTKPNLNLLEGTDNHTVTGTGSWTDGYLSNETNDDLTTLFKELEGQTVTVSADYKYSGFVAGSGNNRLGWEAQLNTDSRTFWHGPWHYPNKDSGSGRISSTFVVPKNIISGNQNRGYIQFSGSGTGTLSHLKIEKGDKATPWMPSASEVKPSDQPKYIGTYVDKSDSDSQDPKKYTWKLNPDYHE